MLLYPQLQVLNPAHAAKKPVENSVSFFFFSLKQEKQVENKLTPGKLQAPRSPAKD